MPHRDRARGLNDGLKRVRRCRGDTAAKAPGNAKPEVAARRKIMHPNCYFFATAARKTQRVFLMPLFELAGRGARMIFMDGKVSQCGMIVTATAMAL